MSLIQQALKDRYLRLDQARDQVVYLPQGKTRTLSAPEEQVQLQTYLQLIYDYGYPPEQLRVCEKVTLGSSTREADIVVYRDKQALDPWIIIECKKEGVSERVFESAVDQGFSYAAATQAEYVWATSGDRNAVYEVRPDAINERQLNRLPRIPKFSELDRPGRYRLKSGLGRWLRHPITTDTIMFLVTLTVTTIAFALLAVAYNDEIRSLLRSYFPTLAESYLWLFYSIVVLATFLSMTLGLLFMRSHQLFGRSVVKKRAVQLLIAMILFAPVWYAGTFLSQDTWWQPLNFERRAYPIFLYLWPYAKSLPFQFIALYGLIWISSRGKDA